MINKSVRLTAATEILVLGQEVIVDGVYANATSSGTVSLRNAAAIAGGGTPELVLDGTAFAAVTGLNLTFPLGLTYQGSAAGTDVTIIYREVH